MKRPARPTTNALRRRKPGAHVAYRAPMLSAMDSADSRRALAQERLTAPIEDLRQDVLATIATLAPAVLVDLAAIDNGDSAALDVWAEKHGIDAPWVLVVARNTLRLWAAYPAWRGSRWDINQSDHAMFIPSRGRLPQPPAEILVRPEHIEWLVRRRVLRQRYEDITDPPETSRKAIRALAKRIGL